MCQKRQPIFVTITNMNCFIFLYFTRVKCILHAKDLWISINKCSFPTHITVLLPTDILEWRIIDTLEIQLQISLSGGEDCLFCLRKQNISWHGGLVSFTTKRLCNCIVSYCAHMSACRSEGDRITIAELVVSQTENCRRISHSHVCRQFVSL